MEITKTDRGFTILHFKDRYDTSCSIQQSSLAEFDCIWLGVDDANPKIMARHADKFGIKTDHATGWVDYPMPVGVLLTTRMHISRDQVAELIPRLQGFVDTGNI